jgi:uncharacterized membrane protein
MWFIGLVVGGLIGAAIGDLLLWDSAWQLFAAIGAVAAVALKSKGVFDPEAMRRLEERIATLERELRVLNARREAAAPPAGAAAAAESVALEDRTPVQVPAAAFKREGPNPPLLAEARAAAEPSWLSRKLFGGNILAKIGVVLLFFGIASGLKLAIDFGFFPASVRLLLATVAGVAMLAFGYTRSRVEKHRMFGLSLQGGGFGVLYLVTYFALARYAYIDHTTAFVLFAALGIGCLVLAVRLEGEPLAVLGISGAFLAPLIASTGAGSHTVLFSFYTVLVVLVLAVNWLRAWRMLMLTAFTFTLTTGMSWASLRFHPEFFASTEAFLILFTVLYSVAPILSAFAGRASPAHWADTALLFGTPIAAALSQTWLLDRAGYSHVVLAWSAVGAGLYYSVLAAVLHTRRPAERVRLAYAGIAAAFYTLAVPLAFGVQVTTALWAAEGLALAWYGLASARRFGYAAGVMLQLVAGVYFLIGWHRTSIIPVLNDTYFGCIVIAACGAATAWATRRQAAWPSAGLIQVLSALAGGWALGWWLTANAAEIFRFAPNDHKIALYTALLIVTAWSLVAIGRALAWTGARYVGLLLAALSLLGALFAGWAPRTGHPLHDSMILALPAAFVSFYAMLIRQERDRFQALLSEAHVYALLLLALALLREALWTAEQLAPNVELWRLLAWQLVPCSLALLTIHLDRHRAWPVRDQHRAYLLGGALPLLFAALGAALVANFSHHGGGTALPYLPFASFFDVGQIAVVFTAWAWIATARSLMDRETARLAGVLPAALAFVWLSAMAMRLAHHWGGVPFEADALIQSGFAQSILSLLWTAVALAVMIRASNKRLRSAWFAGFVLLGIVAAKFVLIDVINEGTVTWTLSLIGVGLLILAASYFSPAPPKAREEAIS